MDLELTYKADDGREIKITPKVTWDDLDQFFDQRCEGTYIGPTATKFINLDALYEDEEFLEWAQEHWKDDGMQALKDAQDEEDYAHQADLDWAVDVIETEAEDELNQDVNIQDIIKRVAEKYELDPQEVEQEYQRRNG